MVSGQPIGAFVRSVVQGLRARRAEAAAQAATEHADLRAMLGAASEATVEPTAVAFLHLALATRGHGLAELAIEAARLAHEAALHVEHIEGLTYGRTYGDPALRGVEPARCLVALLTQARKRADQLGAIADLLRALVGREAALDDVLTGGAGV